MKLNKESYWAIAITSVVAIVLIILVYFSSGSYQGGDTYQHFLIAKYSFVHPTLLLHHWGKPFFTLLYALPAMAGYAAAKLFTCLIGIAGAYISYLVARTLQQSAPIVVLFMVLFAPMYFIHLNSVMTEVLFSTWLILGIYLLLKHKWMAAALLLSLLPFIRTEGFVLIPFISIWMMMHKKWKPFFLLASGTVVYSLIGWVFHYHDVLWIFHQNPYAVQSPYGSGHWLHFVYSNKVIWGLPLFIAMCVGLLCLCWSCLVVRKEAFAKQYLILIVIPFFVFLIFHSAAWALGALASNGETRVMVCTMPLAALIAGYAFSRIEYLIKNKVISNAILGLFVAVVVITPFQFFKMPLEKSERQQLITEACVFVEQQGIKTTVHFVDPQIPVELDADPFSPAQAVQWFADKQQPQNGMKHGDIVIWDAQFCAHEAGTSYSAFGENENYKLLKLLEPQNPIYIYGSEKYFVAIFECIK
jgi:Gpi18-like mannosyltransferase